MAEEQQVTKEPQQVQQEPQRVTTKNPKKVEAGKRLAEHNCRRREEKKREEAVQKTAERGELNQYYGIGAVMAVGVIGDLGYYIYRTKKAGLQGPVSGEIKDVSFPCNPTPRSQTNKFEMD